MYVIDAVLIPEADLSDVPQTIPAGEQPSLHAEDYVALQSMNTTFPVFHSHQLVQRV